MQADFELGGWSVRPGRLILEREGETAHVKPKTMDVLVCLAERAGAVVSREELLTRVWQNVYVTDDVITQAIAELRRAVHDDRRQPAFLETVPRRGYRLLQPVRFSEREIAPSRAAAADTVPRSSVARRRFRWEALLATAAMTVVFLGWVAVREGSIIRSELQLLRAARQTPSDPRPTRDTEAYEHYLKARQKFRPYSPEPDQMVEALSLATRAVERDPQFAQAHALIAEIETFRGFWNRGARDEVLRHAREAADAALAIDPSLSYPHAVSGLATAVLDWKWEEGYRLAVRGSELDPDDVRSMSLRSVLSLTRGKSAEAVQLAYRAYALEPINPHTVGILSWVLYQARQFDEAAGFMAKTLEVDANALFARNFRPLALAYASRFEDALAAERDRPPHPAHRENLALILALAGRPDEARRCLLELDPSADAVETAWGVLGEKEIVLKRLERLIEKRMTNYLMWLRTAPAWDPVRGDARFDRALRRVGLTDPGPPDPTGAPQ